MFNTFSTLRRVRIYKDDDFKRSYVEHRVTLDVHTFNIKDSINVHTFNIKDSIKTL